VLAESLPMRVKRGKVHGDAANCDAEAMIITADG
jgi:hypothetical protein